MDPIDVNELKSSGASKVVKKVPILTDEMIATTLFFDSNIRIPPHVHEDVDELHYIIRGSGRLSIGDKSKQIMEGMLILVPKNESHCYSTDTEHLMVLAIRTIESRVKNKDFGTEGNKKSKER